MTTQNQADQWLGQQVGQHLDYDGQYGQQCFDFFNYYYQFITGEGPYGDGYAVPGAKDIWDVPTDFFDKIPDSRTLEPGVGDVLIYDGTWGAGFGHVEVCRWSDADGCHVIGENEHGNASEGVVEVYRTWGNMRGLIGVMRPRFAPEPTPEPAPEPVPAPVEPPVEPPVVVPDPVPVPDPGTVITPEPAPAPTPAPEPKPEPQPAPTPAVNPSLFVTILNAVLRFLKAVWNA